MSLRADYFGLISLLLQVGRKLVLEIVENVSHLACKVHQLVWNHVWLLLQGSLDRLVQVGHCELVLIDHVLDHLCHDIWIVLIERQKVDSVG